MKPILAFACTILTATAAAAIPLGPAAAACAPEASAPALLVSVSGFKTRAGRLRVQLYGADAADFLAKGRKLERIDLPVSAGVMDVCVRLPDAGRYAVAVRHDADGNGKSGWNDGGGFSRNPSISLTSPKPSYNRVAFVAGPGVQRVPVVLQYRRGLSIGPLRKARS